MILGTILVSLLLLSSPTNADRVGDARYQEALNRQCEEVLGFQSDTEDNMKCHLFYEKLFRRMYHISDSISTPLANKIESKIEKMNTTCENYFKDGVVSKELLWTCIQNQGEIERSESTYQDAYRRHRDYLRTIRQHRH